MSRHNRVRMELEIERKSRVGDREVTTDSAKYPREQRGQA